MLCSATAAELMKSKPTAELKLLSRSGEAVDTPASGSSFHCASQEEPGPDRLGGSRRHADRARSGAADRLLLAGGTSLARARSNAAGTVRDVATLAALRDDVLVLDREGVVRSIDHAAAGVPGVRRERREPGFPARSR